MELEERILHRTAELFLDFGIKYVTMDSLANELGVSKRTIYEHFSDKENLVTETLAYMFKVQNQQRSEIIEKSDNAIEAMFEIFKMNSVDHKKMPKILNEDLKKYISAVNAKLFANPSFIKEHSSTYKLLSKGVKEGIFRAEINPELVDVFLTELFPFIFHNERIMIKKCHDNEIFTNILLPYFRGLCTSKGIDLMTKYFDQSEELKTILNKKKE